MNPIPIVAVTGCPSAGRDTAGGLRWLTFFRWVSPLLGLLLAGSAPWLGGCSSSVTDDDGIDEPTATPLPSFAEHPHTWAMVRQFDQQVYLYDSPVTTAGWYRQVVRLYSLATWVDDVGSNDNSITVHQTERLCDVRTSDIEISSKFGLHTLTTVIPDGLVDSIPPDLWDARVNLPTDPEEAPTYALPQTLYAVWGAHLADPLQDRCPMLDESGSSYNEGNLPEVAWDEDNDGNPGVTVELYVDGTFFANTYICQRLNFTQTVASVGRIDGSYHIQGSIRDYLNDQSQYWSDPSKLDDQDPEVSWNLEANGSGTFYILDELPEGATCAEVQAVFGL